MANKQNRLEALVEQTLQDLATQVAYLYSIGQDEDAQVLIQKGTDLAESYDAAANFLVIDTAAI